MHEFFLIKKTETQDDDFFDKFWSKIDNHKDIIVDYITIEIKVFDYIFDSLTWIPCMNPAFPGNPKQVGINHIGLTLFDENSASSLISIFTAWIDLFKNGPSVIKRLIYFHEYSDEDLLTFDRDDTIENFKKFIDIAKQLSDGKYYLYHWGI
ncbi:hypothetical protein [Bacillus ndiopicus]|uniref:hypothetical protein n=1 Tax=Bacillus ndiopicus TaxID=1347368 RepID=UPI0005A99933|nr:hypothetical protein [Bacillus ndiopicus]